ncbi:Hsp20/alpha crystallin family protein [Neobacillus dielmonensis]|uniref:Hsp20/alpha crystallin family protein n=1 Tax=Neobacillus dielmonensis TaxID=1347369 RepID=UPI0005A9A837|nr:Hsp20/alpha crystallin family protein [Neobacillus dielmonensis]
MSNLPSNKNNGKNSFSEPFGDIFKSINQFFNEQPVRGFLQSIDEFFNTPFPFQPGFQVNTAETKDEYIVSAELPGVKREQIHLNTAGNYLTITIDNKELETTEDDQNQIYRRKYVHQQSSRTVVLPTAINEEKIKASYRDGLLKIRIPREKGNVIQIEAED